MLEKIRDILLKEVANMNGTPTGAYNIRLNSAGDGRRSTENIQIISKEDKSGIDIIIKPNTKDESVYIPALVTKSGIHDLVYNDFHIGENSDVVIIAGCGIHNCGSVDSQHDGIHRFFVGKNAKMKYIEKHIGSGDGTGKKIINPVTHIEAEENSYVEIETIQLDGVDSSIRETFAVAKENAKIVVKEKILTTGNQFAETRFSIDMNGDDSSVSVSSRSVAKGNSKQKFISIINGNARCIGHSECDAIIMDRAIVTAVPEITANDVDASLIHEAAIGKIAGDQIIKLMTLGLSEEEAETQIVNGFLK